METLPGLKGIDAESVKLYGGGYGITILDDAVPAYDKIADFQAKNSNRGKRFAEQQPASLRIRRA